MTLGVGKRLSARDIVIVALLAGWLIFNLLTLTKYPVPLCDEAIYTSVGYQFARHGMFVSSPGMGLHGDGLNNTLTGRLFAVGQAIIFLGLGFNLFSARLFIVVAWVSTTWLVWLVARRLYTREVAWVAALTFALSVNTFVRWRLIRPDPWAAFMLVLAFWLYLRLQERPGFRRAFVLGLVASLSLDFYVVTMYFLPIYGFLVLMLRPRRDVLAGFLLGCVLGGTYFVLARAYPDPTTARWQWEYFLPALQRYRISHGGLGAADMASWLTNFVMTNRGLSGVETVLALAGMGLAVRRRQPDELRLLAGYLGGFVLFLLLFTDKGWSHVALWLPFVALMIARAAWSGAEWLAAHRIKLAPVVLLAPWLALNALGGIWLVHVFWNSDFEAETADLRQMIPADAGLWAQESWWFAFPDSRFLFQLHYLAALDDDHVVTEDELMGIFRDQGITYMILEDGQHCHEYTLAPPSFTVREAVAKYCTEVGNVTGYFSEAIGEMTARAYRCNFEAPEP